MAEKTQERLELEARAIDLGVEFAGNIGDEKLAARVEAALIVRSAENTPLGPVADSGAADDAAAPLTDPAPASGLVVVVTGPAKGRRRAGRSFGPEEVEIALDELSEDQQATLINDPELVVTTREAS